MNLVCREETDVFILEAKASEDQLKLFIDVTKKSDVVPQVADLFNILEKHISKELIHKGVLKSIVEALQEEDAVKERRVAKGTAPIKGDSGKFLALVKEFSLERSKDQRPGSAGSLRHRQVFENIEKGTVVGRVYPPKPGVDGVNVFGEVLSAEVGDEAALNIDFSTLELLTPRESDKTYKELGAKVEGYLENRSGSLRIVEELVVSQDVDYHFGNINFIGKVIVRGMVKPGFQIIAKKGIEIAGNVTRGSLICQGADITVKGLVIGRRGDPAKVVCGGKLEILGASNTLFEVKGDMQVKKELRDCVIRCGQTLYATEATIVGGKVLAVCGIDSKILGSSVGVKTKLYLTSDVEMSGDYRVLRREIERHERAETMLVSHLGYLKDQPQKVERLSEPHRSHMRTMLKKLEAVQKSRAVLEKKRELMLAEAKWSSESRINFHKMMYAGVEIFSFDSEFINKEDTPGPKSVLYSSEDQCLQLGEVGPLECRWIEQ